MQNLRRLLVIGTLLVLPAAGAMLLAQTAPAAPQVKSAAPATQAAPAALGKITSPKDAWGHNVGDDYFLANYTQLEEYWKVLDRESERMSP